jgi:YegS/Rv2252/BmrU family lipid kinase
LRVCCIINSNSGTAQKASATRLVELFAKHGAKAEILQLGQGASIIALAKEAADRDWDVLVAGGGDGTINAVASALVGKEDKTLGILPLGTFNHFARDLGVPLELEDAVKIVVKGSVRLVDVGEVNGRLFLNNSCLGLYPSLVRLRESLQKSGYSKLRAFLRASLHVLMRFSRLYLELYPANGRAVRRKTPVLFIGNNAYETSLAQLGTRSSLEQGQLWIMMPTAASRWSLLVSFFAILGGREKATDLITFEGEKLTVASARRRLKVAVDGEVLQLKTPLYYRIRPKALRVIAPQEPSNL